MEKSETSFPGVKVRGNLLNDPVFVKKDCHLNFRTNRNFSKVVNQASETIKLA